MKSLVSFPGLCLLLAFTFTNVEALENYPEPCESNIYCYGPLLETIQLNKLYPDDKTFVDLSLKSNPAIVYQNFIKLNINGSVNGNATLLTELKDFVAANFENGTEFKDWEPTDYVENPTFLNFIVNDDLKNWAKKLNSFWHELGREIDPKVNVSSALYSMHYVSHPVIVPGGRFKEFYYWDSYWIQKGLLVSQMSDTVKGMIENFFEMVNTLDYIPNGGRIYYERTQPPFLLPMVKNYYEYTKDVNFLIQNIKTMEKEFDFFINNRTIEFSHGNKTYTMSRYNVDRRGPRPESYSKDYELVEPLQISEDEKEALYANLKAGAESGWDFSSRWFVPSNNSEDKGNLSDTKTRDIIPADLNGLIYWNAVILAEFCQLISINNASCDKSTEYYQNKSAEWKTAIAEVLWDEESGSWFDYNFVLGELNKEFYPSNLVPLWVKAQHNDSVIPKVIKYLVDSGATNYPGGIPTSLEQSGEQWDYPNAWPPLNHIVVEALENSGNAEGKALAFELAEKWIRSNHRAYLQTENMFEKYDVTCEGCVGGGGEYEVVLGFGWTNGVILDFLKVYGDRVTPSPNIPSPSPGISSTTPISQSTTTTPKPSSSTAIGFSSVIIILASLSSILFNYLSR